MPQNWDLDPKTGDYVMTGGAPKQTNSLRVPAYIRLKVPRLGWLYAPNTLYGSDFRAIKKRQTNRDATTLENTAGRALQPIVDDGRSATMDITTTAVSRNGIGLNIKIVEASGTQDQLNLPSIGV
jgi:phage gp46-like protein